MRYLVNEDGTPFKYDEIQSLRDKLDALDNDQRFEYRNQNASFIAEHGAKRFLIVSGPGTGKSHLFLNRINHWFREASQAKIFVTSFVRKLVADLQNDINSDNRLFDPQKKEIFASTLHKFARSIVERNHGTSEWRFRPHFRIIGHNWKDIVWSDVLAFFPELKKQTYAWNKFEKQLHEASFDGSEEWQNLKETYFKLCQLYNAAGFADLILRAKDALSENPELNESTYFIIDEYQDFNSAEEALITQLVNDSDGLLVVGDDEQVLYEKLKSGEPTLIRDLYKNKNYANGMLPFSGRGSFHITKSAAHFIQQERDLESIDKIYLPLKLDDDNPKVQIIACASASAAVDYIEKFVKDNKEAIDERKKKLAEGKEKDAFLLILTPDKKIKFYVTRRFDGKRRIDELISDYQSEYRHFSEDYYKILNYYSLANYPQNNFTFRKVLHYENIKEARIHEVIESAMRSGQDFCDLEFEEIKGAIQRCHEIKSILEQDGESIENTIERIAAITYIVDKEKLKEDITQKSINEEKVKDIEHTEEEEAELDAIEVKKMGALELMTIVGSKGLSADHVIMVGFDNVNMNWTTRNAFYVAMTRARKSLHLLTALKSGGARQAHNFLNLLTDDHAEYYSYKKSNHIKSQLLDKQDFERYINTLNFASRKNS